MATPKIWIKAPDPTRACCACDGKTGPCSACSPCSGLRFNETTQIWDVFNLTLPGNCIIAQDAIDSYVQTNNTVTATITNALGHRTPNQSVTFRTNGISVYLKSGDIVRVDLSNVVTTDQLLYIFSQGKSPSDPFYFYNAQYYLNHLGNIQNRNSNGTIYATVLSQDFTEIPLPTNLTNSLYAFGEGTFPYLTLSSNEYANDLVKSLSYTGLIAPLQTTVTPGINSPRFSWWGSAGSFVNSPYAEISFSTTTITAPSVPQTCWTCHGFSNAWVQSSSSATFGLTQADTDMWNQFVQDYITLEKSLTNGNRGLGFNQFLYSSDTNSITVGTLFTGPVYLGIPCAPGNDGQVLCYNGYNTIDYYTSTNWPRTANLGPLSITNFFRFQAIQDICLDIVPGYGGLYPSATYNNSVKTQSITGNSYITDTITVTNETNALNVTPIFFYTGNKIKINCPFTLP